MTGNDEAGMTVEKRLDVMGEDLRAVRVVQEQHTAQLQRLQVLHEQHDEHIQRIAEVQTAHGVKLEQHGSLLEEHGQMLREIKGELAGVNGALAGVQGALKPLPAIHDVVNRIANEHEARITALEKSASAQ